MFFQLCCFGTQPTQPYIRNICVQAHYWTLVGTLMLLLHFMALLYLHVFWCTGHSLLGFVYCWWSHDIFICSLHQSLSRTIFWSTVYIKGITMWHNNMTCNSNSGVRLQLFIFDRIHSWQIIYKHIPWCDTSAFCCTSCHLIAVEATLWNSCQLHAQDNSRTRVSLCHPLIFPFLLFLAQWQRRLLKQQSTCIKLTRLLEFKTKRVHSTICTRRCFWNRVLQWLCLRPRVLCGEEWRRKRMQGPKSTGAHCLSLI